MKFRRVLALLSVAACSADSKDRPDSAVIADGGSTDGGGVVDAGADGGSVRVPCDGPPGLYEEGFCDALAEGVVRFTPTYPLWSDAAEKERFVFLPQGTTIDTTNPDGWVFPIGTKFFKNFSRDGKLVETRINTKTTEGMGIASWAMQTYVWNEEQTGVTELTEGMDNALGTDHDIPATALCTRCHNTSTPDVALGFSAIQINNELTDVSLADLNESALLTTPISVDDAVIPGEPAAKAALGYMHSNCGSCHGGSAPLVGMVFWVNVGATTVEETGTFTTAVGQRGVYSMGGSKGRIVPGHPEQSAVVYRMTQRGLLGTPEGAAQMPPLATEVVDTEGLALVSDWIESLPK